MANFLAVAMAMVPMKKNEKMKKSCKIFKTENVI